MNHCVAGTTSSPTPSPTPAVEVLITFDMNDITLDDFNKNKETYTAAVFDALGGRVPITLTAEQANETVYEEVHDDGDRRRLRNVAAVKLRKRVRKVVRRIIVKVKANAASVEDSDMLAEIIKGTCGKKCMGWRRNKRW